eukprot:TRINITY_DN2032_c0_g1_i3.p1 TRINITY_DN2032_c0_g1~~TRINITY_DN2032_c0_g1_i3.p1  ORF type:complete len:239 (-),score=47.49 TRINITY_DN2032_c0_g1_i3:4-720(-)
MSGLPVTAYLGPEGTHTHNAAIKHFEDSPQKIDGKKLNFLCCKTVSAVFDAILTNKASYGFIPIQNSISGIMRESHDMLFDTEVKVIGEMYDYTQHYLAAKPGVRAKEIDKIYSHPHAFVQCKKSLEKDFGGVLLLTVESTALGAQLAEKDPKAAAITTKEAAKLYNLEVLKENMQDTGDKNFTRFLIIGKEIQSISTGNDKTLLVFGVKDTVGALTKVLSIFPVSYTHLTLPTKRIV